MSLETLKQRLAIAEKAARLAGEIHRRHYGKPVAVEIKSSDIDLVTAVDRECDALIRETLQAGCAEAGFTDDTMITEETFQEGQLIDLTGAWVVDPLDGTTNYAHGFPYFAVSIAYVENGQPQVALVYDAIRDELFTAIRGQGAFLNGEKISVSRAADLEQALLATGFPYDTQVKPQDNMGYFLKFMTICHGVRRAGAAAVDLAYLACGRLDGFWELRLSPWDVAAGGLLVEEAGGKITGFHGEPLNYGQRRISILGSNATAIHQQIVDICSLAPALNKA